jgi:hypothetical protein
MLTRVERSSLLLNGGKRVVGLAPERDLEKMDLFVEILPTRKHRKICSLIKLFTAVIYGFLEQARMFIPGKPFQPSLMLVGKARSQP